LVEELWDSIAADQVALALTDAQRRELDRRVDAYEADRLNAASVAKDMNLPGLRLHELVENRTGTWSVSVSGNWRVTFRFTDGDAEVVNYEDYH
jgi:putative addiction module component (TIGR02574 family)